MNPPPLFVILLLSGQHRLLCDCLDKFPNSVQLFRELVAQFDKQGRVSVMKQYIYLFCVISIIMIKEQYLNRS